MLDGETRYIALNGVLLTTSLWASLSAQMQAVFATALVPVLLGIGTVTWRYLSVLLSN